MDSLTGSTDAGASSSNSTAATSSSAAPNSAELMMALSQIQQLIPLLDYRPGGLTHLLPTLLTPLLPCTPEAQVESMQRYRANVDHAFRVAGELVGRVHDGGSVANALELAERLMQSGDERTRLLRVRKKRRLFVEQEKVLEVNSWGPPVPSRATVTDKKEMTKTKEEDAGDKREAVEIASFLPSQNPPNIKLAPTQQNLPPPTTPQAVQKYLSALHSYLKVTVEKGLAPQTIPLKHVRARLVALAPEGFTLEVQIAQVLKACVDASFTYVPHPHRDGAEIAEGDEASARQLQSVDLAALTLGGVNESITSTTPSAFPIFRSLSADLLAQTTRAASKPAREKDRTASSEALVWTAYEPITETIARLILAAAQLQT